MTQLGAVRLVESSVDGGFVQGKGLVTVIAEDLHGISPKQASGKGLLFELACVLYIVNWTTSGYNQLLSASG